jgi:hypothetical protein
VHARGGEDVAADQLGKRVQHGRSRADMIG